MLARQARIHAPRAFVRRRARVGPCPPPPRAGKADADADAPDADAAAPPSLGDAPSSSAPAANASPNAAASAQKAPHFARLVEAPPSGAPGPAGQQPRSAAVPLPSVPPELEGLALTADGDLVDAKTGKRLPALGEPTRFDIMVAALRGELDPPAWRPNTERSPGALVAALLGPFPLDYEFCAVGRPSQGQSPEAFANELAALVHRAAACPGPVPSTTVVAEAEGDAAGDDDGGAPSSPAAKAKPPPPPPRVSFKERLGGKYVKVSVTARVRSADLLEEGFTALAADPRVMMRY